MYGLIYMVPKFYSMEPHIFIAMILQYNLTLGMVILLAVSVGGGEFKKNGAVIMKSVQKILRKLETNLP